ncbi:MAG: sugar dehydrogenase complex small subunit [Azospirillaceae bacterium]|nr:sugar dehydrogenase complex small subunit [Azospirillaceae bacterium]
MSFPLANRRTFLISAGRKVLAGLAVSFVSFRPAAAAAIESDGDRFLRISQVLTGKSDLDPTISARTLSALTAHDAGFATRLGTLASTLDATVIPPDADFDQTPIAAQPALRQTAIEIVSAWYLGVVGTTVIAYEEALMYRPTRDITAPPATQSSVFGSWATKPA